VAEENGRTSARRGDRDGAIDKPEPARTERDCQATLAALRASPHCRRIIASGPTQVWTLSSREQVEAFKHALGRD
jgi:hypothetical protein